MKKTMLLCALIAGSVMSAGCFGDSGRDRVEVSAQAEAPKEVFDPEEAFSEIPHSGFKAEWLEGGMKDEDGRVYEEIYDFVLTMERAVIPYTVSGKLIQTCEYDDAGKCWNVDRRTENVVQEMDLSTYSWTMEGDSVYKYTETFFKTGPNTFETGSEDQPTGVYFTVDILGGGTNLKDEEGLTNLPGGQWTARLYIESDRYPEFTFRGEAAIDLLGGSYGYNDSRWVVTISELKRVEKELNMTDEERAQIEQNVFQKTFPDAADFEVMDYELTDACTAELTSADFGNVSVDAAAIAKDRDGVLMGWVVNVSSKDSYMGNMAVSVAVQSDGTVGNLEFLVLEDTPGLGMRAQEDIFKSQFEGKGGEPLTVTQSGNPGHSEIDAISGATITSTAVTNAVNAALYYVNHFTETDKSAYQGTQSFLAPE